MESSSLKRQHKGTFRTLAEQAKHQGQKSIRKFVLYSLRHTFLTRLGESGCDAWTLARIAGHNDIRISARYVHPSEDAVLVAMTRLGGHKSGHSELPASSQQNSQRQLTQ
jgi:site-specific recombinase XerD